MYRRRLWHQCGRYVGFSVSDNGGYDQLGTVGVINSQTLMRRTEMKTNLKPSFLTPCLDCAGRSTSWCAYGSGSFGFATTSFRCRGHLYDLQVKKGTDT